jgi:molybdopterin adenylyltransferase
VNRAVVVTISDSASQGLREDKSGPAVVERLRQAGFEVTLRDAIPDDREQIATVLRELAGAGRRLAIFTTGGFGELMRTRGRESTPFAVLSRAIAGTRGGVLIINLPGSPRGAVESLDAILELVPHVLDLINGRTSHSLSERV